MPPQIGTLSQTTPFLLSYSPYTTPENTLVAETIEDMISYNLVVNDAPTRLSYISGAEGTYSSTFTIKNIATNIVLDVQVERNTEIFSVKLDPLTFSLEPLQTKSFIFELDKQYLNSLTNKPELQARLDVRINNRQNGSVILASTTTQRIPAERIPATIDVV